MPRADFLHKRGDTLPARRFRLKAPDGSAFTNLVGAAITFFFQSVDEDPSASPMNAGAGSFTVVGGANPTGEIDYNWAEADVTKPVGRYRFEVEVLPATGGRATFPQSGYGLFDLVQDLGDG